MEEGPFKEDIVRKSDRDTFASMLKYAVRSKVIDMCDRGKLTKPSRLAKLAGTNACQVKQGALAFNCALPGLVVSASPPPIPDQIDL
ncbi:hypothetical protein [Paraburkholderia graminis]|uniref:hypothetical protein n=1 Tax=Paraburkholderia graminis TaxID=60548 RepID=UPI00278E369B|nr:hypothetical protein [Paraburkholderia graminis]MDQ0621618.1 hypothetical protein [Paraburkholderia graminis]